MSIQNPSQLERSIVRTVAFFDIFDYPLTDTEVQKFLLTDGSGDTLLDIRECLASSLFCARVLEAQDGLYHVRGRGVIRMLRRERALSSYGKHRRARRMVTLLAHVPFVRMIAVCNTLGLNAAREESDIDFFIIARAGHLWCARLLCAGIAHFLGIRPRRGHERDTVCLSFYAADTALDISSLQLPGWTPDLYLAYWITWCVPLYDDGVFQEFFQAQTWLAACLPNSVVPHPIAWRRVILAPVSRAIKRIVEKLFSSCVFERAARAFQLRIMPFVIREQMNGGTGVVVSDSILKFHTADRRQEIKRRFMATCDELGIR